MREVKTVLQGKCNAGVSISKKAGAFKKAFAIATEALPEAPKVTRFAGAALMIRALT